MAWYLVKRKDKFTFTLPYPAPVVRYCHQTDSYITWPPFCCFTLCKKNLEQEFYISRNFIIRHRISGLRKRSVANFSHTSDAYTADMLVLLRGN
jgi:hypothetical protein